MLSLFVNYININDIKQVSDQRTLNSRRIYSELCIGLSQLEKSNLENIKVTDFWVFSFHKKWTLSLLISPLRYFKSSNPKHF